MPESVDHPIILRELLRYRRTHLLLLALVFTVSAFSLRFLVLQFASSTTVVVIDGIKSEGKTNERNAPDFLLSTDQFNRIHQVVYSNGMYDHLIRTFRLFAHYGIDSTDAAAYAGVVDRLSGSIEVKKTPYNAAVITVHDHDPGVATAMANEIAVYTDTLNAAWLMRIQAKRLAVYQSALDDLEQRIRNRQQEVDTLLKRLQVSGKEDASSDDLRRAVNGLTATVEMFRSESKQLVFVLETLQKRNYPTIWQQERALPERSSLLLPALIWSIGITLFGLVLLILFHYFRLIVQSPTVRTILLEADNRS